MYIAYCPELDLSGYDTNENGARKSFEVALNDYLDYTTQNGTLEEDLLSHGWRKYKDGRITVPSIPTLVRKPQFSDVLRRKEYRKYSVPVSI